MTEASPPTQSVVPILDVPISRMGMDDALTFCGNRVASHQGGYVCFANVHTVTESQSNSSLRAALNSALLAVADGLPLVWVSRLMGRSVNSRVCGPDFMTEFLKRYPDFTYGLIGGSTQQTEELVRRFGIQAVCLSPPMRPFSEANASEDWELFLIRAKEESKSPQIVWVGLGAPKQELWMHTVSKKAPSVIFFGVGAAYDFLTGTKNRAPLWMQKSGLEWFYRLAQEPRRLWKRYLGTNSKFLAHLTRHFFLWVFSPKAKVR
ncbi:WecB/TagA/CpsF family glycosyltransferase [bacterium]|nr:WecB/TagA/CpsF family glycosyltransferase [bacterium]